MREPLFYSLWVLGTRLGAFLLLGLSACGPPPFEPPFSGLYHEVGGDYASLMIREDAGAFRYGYDHCDVRWVREGTYSIEGDALVLVPFEGEPTIAWGRGAGASKVRLERGDAPESLRAIVTTRIGTEEQTWSPGGQCPRCGGLAPTGFGPCRWGSFREGL